MIKGVLTLMGSSYTWQEGNLKGKGKWGGGGGKMVFNSLGYNRTDQEVKT